MVVPFNAVIESNSDIKNYADYLLQNAGSAVLTWVIEGARKFIENDFNLTVPACVQNAINEYKTQNDWLGAFIADTCNVGIVFRKRAAIFTRYTETTAWHEVNMYAVPQTSYLH